MTKDFAGAVVSRSDFDRLVALCSCDPSFPRTYPGWLQLVSEGERLATEAGLAFEPLELNVTFFEQWCRMTGIRPCLQALRAMLIVERAGTQQGLQSLSAPAREAAKT